MSLDSTNVVFLGSQANAATLGKRSTQTDMTFFSRKDSRMIRTYIVPSGFPDKIQPLFQSINLAEHAIFYVESLDRFTGEQILALDAIQKGSGILCHAPSVDHDTLLRAVQNTIVNRYDIVEPDQIKQAANRLISDSIEGPPAAVVDHAFSVKGAGTIVLGKVISGVISKYDNMRVMPSGLDVMIKSIQMHDDPTTSAPSPARVGLALKGITPDKINRGDILCGAGYDPTISDTIRIDFTKTPFYKGGYDTGQMCIINIGLQVVSAKITRTEPLVLSLDRPAVFHADARPVILKPDSQTVRIMGSGTIMSYD